MYQLLADTQLIILPCCFRSSKVADSIPHSYRGSLIQFIHEIISSRSVSMATDCVIFLKVEFCWFLGSIQLRIVRMALVFDQLSNALLAETGAKRLIKKKHAKRQTTTTTGKQTMQHQHKRASRSNRPAIYSHTHS